MNNKGFTITEVLAGLIIAMILFLIFVEVVNPTELTPEQEMENCMYDYEDFEYCKYKLGVE